MAIPRPADAAPREPWQQQLGIIVEMMRDMSLQTDPQEMVRAYAQKVRELRPTDGRLSLSRRDLKRPQVRITRSTTWKQEVNPWTEQDRLPLIDGGLLADLIYADKPTLIEDLQVPTDDPAFEYLASYRSLLAIPMFDGGESLNMVVLLQKSPAGFDKDAIPEMVWMSNLFGRATNNLVLAQRLRDAYQALDQQMKLVGEIQKSLLPAKLPRIPTLDLATHYQPSERAGGDYYDFFPLPGGQWGIFIADVSGHGTPAAVLMAVTHCIAHTHPGPPQPPAEVLSYLNRHLANLYTRTSGAFITAFYGVYDPATRSLTYANAGHPPPRLKRCQDGSLFALEGSGSLPLGILAEEGYTAHRQQLQPGDQLILYTDGITEATNPTGEYFGIQRLDGVLENCSLQAEGLMKLVLEELESFAAGHAADDDRTLIVGRVT